MKLHVQLFSLCGDLGRLEVDPQIKMSDFRKLIIQNWDQFNIICWEANHSKSQNMKQKGPSVPCVDDINLSHRGVILCHDKKEGDGNDDDDDDITDSLWNVLGMNDINPSGIQKKDIKTINHDKTMDSDHHDTMHVRLKILLDPVKYVLNVKNELSRKTFNIAPPPKMGPPFLIYEDWLYQSSQKQVTASNFHSIRLMKITHIINVTDELKYSIPQDLENQVHLQYYSIMDNESQDILSLINQVNEFIQKERKKREKAKFVIHCLAGISRSVTLTVGILMINSKMSLNDCMNWMREKRNHNNTNPNPGFMKQLFQLEKQLFNK